MSAAALPGVEMEVVRAGSRVQVRDDDGEQEFTIVEPGEEDVSAGRVSSVSPIGRAVLGQAAGERVVVRAPGGRRLVRIVAILESGSEVEG